MNRSRLIEAIAKANLFIRAAVICKDEHHDEIPMMGSKYTAAARRASMELTRALAELRKSS